MHRYKSKQISMYMCKYETCINKMEESLYVLQ